MLHKEWQTGDRESDWGMISSVTKICWKEVNRVRKGEEGKEEKVKDMLMAKFCAMA